MEKTGMNMGSVKQKNRALILNYINSCGPVSRKDVAAAAGLTPASVTQIVNSLISDGFLMEAGPSSEPAGSAGRKKILLDIRADAEYVYAVNIEPDETTVALCDLKARPVSAEDGTPLIRHMKTDGTILPEAFLGQIADSCLTLAALAPQKCRERLRAVSVGITGIVDTENGISRQAYGIWETKTDVRSILGGRLGLPLFLENNVDAFAIAELLFGTGRIQDNLLIIKWGPGVGSTIVINDSVYKGRHGKTAEIGHQIVEKNGRPCSCGRRGCLETIVSYNALNALMPFIPEDFEKSYLSAPGPVKSQVDDAIDLFARSVVNAGTIIAPKRIVLFGKMFRSRRIRDMLISACSAYDASYNANRILYTNLSEYESYIGPAAVYVQNCLKTR